MFKNNLDNNVAKPARIALSANIIEEICDFSDKETVLLIQEKPNLQVLIGLKEHTQKKLSIPH